MGWADPGTGSAFAFVHNRLSTPMVPDMASFAGLARLLPKYGGRYRAPAAFA